MWVGYALRASLLSLTRDTGLSTKDYRLETRTKLFQTEHLKTPVLFNVPAELSKGEPWTDWSVCSSDSMSDMEVLSPGKVCSEISVVSECSDASEFSKDSDFCNNSFMFTLLCCSWVKPLYDSFIAHSSKSIIICSTFV